MWRIDSDTSEPAQSLDDVLASVSGLTGKARTDKLVELAAEEGGSVDVYTSSSVDYMTELSDAFEDAYDLDVSLVQDEQRRSRPANGRGGAGRTFTAQTSSRPTRPR